VMTSLLKGPPGRMKLIDASSAHQMFGRAGRPQFDSQGYVFAVAHEDDVRLHRWQEKYDAIPEDTRDPMLIRAKKNLKKKMPKRREGQQYWTEKQFQVLREAPPARLASRGRFPWRMLAWFIRRFGTVVALQDAVRRRLLDPDGKDDAEKVLQQMLLTLESAGFVTLDPPPPEKKKSEAAVELRSELIQSSVDPLELHPPSRSVFDESRWVWHEGDVEEELDEATGGGDESGFGTGVFSDEPPPSSTSDDVTPEEPKQETPEVEQPAPGAGLLGQLINEARDSGGVASTRKRSKAKKGTAKEDSGGGHDDEELIEYEPRLAVATDKLPLLFAFRSVNSIFGVFVAEHLHRASYTERLQLLEAMLEMPMSVGKMVRVPFPDRMPPGPMATQFLNPELIRRGLVTQEELNGYRDEETGRRIPPLALADKFRMLFRAEYPSVHDVRTTSVWCIGDLLTFGGDFSKYVRARDLTKQEGVVFRHCLRMVLLCGEFAQIQPPDLEPRQWQRDLAELASMLTESCRAVDRTSTDETLERLANRSTEPSIV